MTSNYSTLVLMQGIPCVLVVSVVCLEYFPLHGQTKFAKKTNANQTINCSFWYFVLVVKSWVFERFCLSFLGASFKCIKLKQGVWLRLKSYFDTCSTIRLMRVGVGCRWYKGDPAPKESWSFMNEDVPPGWNWHEFLSFPEFHQPPAKRKRSVECGL